VMVIKCVQLENDDAFSGLQVGSNKSDPYVCIKLRQLSGSSMFIDQYNMGELRTAVIDDVLEPVFNQAFEFIVDAAHCTAESGLEAELVFEVWDDDLGSDDLLGIVTVPLSEAVAQSGPQKLALKGDNCSGSIHIQVEQQTIEERQAKRDGWRALAAQHETVQLQIEKCTGLVNPSAGSFGFSSDLDSFVKAVLRQPDGAGEEFCTDAQSGLDPEYGDVFYYKSNAAQFAASSIIEAMLVLQVWNKRAAMMGGDQLVGEVCVGLIEAVGVEGNQTLELKAAGAGVGTIHFVIKHYPTT